MGQHFRSALNCYFGVRKLRRILRSRDVGNDEKRWARADMADITSFKQIISNAALLPAFDTIDCNELRKYQNVVFIDPNIRDTLFMMHKDSTCRQPRLARYTSMTRWQHLGTKNRNRTRRFIEQQPNLNDIKNHQDQMSTTNAYSISAADFHEYCSKWGEAKEILGPLYEQPIFQKARWRTSIGNQRNFAFRKISFIASLAKIPSSSASATYRSVERPTSKLQHKASVCDIKSIKWDSKSIFSTNFEHHPHVQTVMQTSTFTVNNVQALGHGDEISLHHGYMVGTMQKRPVQVVLVVETKDGIRMYWQYETFVGFGFGMHTWRD
jgi:hypothetical protein